MQYEQMPRACPACSCPLMDSGADYCARCESPVSLGSTFDPLKTIRTQGELFRRGASRPSGIVVVGMWLIFGPILFVIVIAALSAGAAAPAGFLAAIVISSPILILYGAILYKVTSRYVAFKNDLRNDDEEEEETADAADND